MDQLFVDELLVAYTLEGVIKAASFVVSSQPSLPCVCLALVEGKAYGIVVFAFLQRPESNHVLGEVSEVLLCLLAIRGAQTFVVLDFAACQPTRPFLDPLFVVCDREEAVSLLAMSDFDDRRHELFEESRNLEQAGPEMVDKVYQEAFDVGAIVILICHYHDRPVTQVTRVRILLPHVEPHDFDNVLQLIVLENHVGIEKVE